MATQINKLLQFILISFVINYIKKQNFIPNSKFKLHF